MRFSTNFISCSVLLLATIMVKGAQADCYCENDSTACGTGATYIYACCAGDDSTYITCADSYIDATDYDTCGGCDACCAPDSDTCVDPTAVTGVTASASDLTIDGFAGASVTCDSGYYAAVGDLGTPTVCSSDNTPWTYTGSCTGKAHTATNCHTSRLTAGTSATEDDSVCTACDVGKFAATNNEVCAAWTDAAAANCADGSVWTAGSTTADSTCVEERVWKTIRGCCRERVENSKRLLNHHGTASTETFFGSLDSVLINCTAACATDAVCTAVEVTKKNRAAAKCEFHVERMNAGDRSTKSCKKATCMVKTGFVAPETAAPPPASPTEWNERRGCCREHAGKKKYVNHVGTNIIIAERTYAAATKACKDECDGRSTCTAVETRRNQRKKVYMCELHTESGINASSRASKSCKKALCAVKV